LYDIEDRRSDRGVLGSIGPDSQPKMETKIGQMTQPSPYRSFPDFVDCEITSVDALSVALPYRFGLEGNKA
jgi:hypothetical protein